MHTQRRVNGEGEIIVRRFANNTFSQESPRVKSFVDTVKSNFLTIEKCNLVGSVSARIALITCLLFGVVSCERKKSPSVGYNEISHEQSVADAKVAFAGHGAEIDVEPEIQSFFTKLGQASKSEIKFETSDYISVDAMIESAEAANVFDGMDSSFKRGFISGFRKGLSNIERSFQQMAFDQHRVVRVEKPSEDRRVVFATLYNSELNISTKMRFWMVKTDQGWRIYDYEDLSVGLRTVAVMATMMKAGVGKNAEPWVADFVPLAKTMQQLDMNDFESIASLREPLQRLMGHDLPTDIRRFGSAMLVNAHTAAEDFDQAEQELEAAQKGGYQSPLANYQRGHLMMNREKWREALDEFRKNNDILGADSDILESISDCHYELGDMKSAHDAALKGLEDNPRAMNLLACLVAASTLEQIAEPVLAVKFEASGDAETAYEGALDYLISLEELEKARALFAACRGRFDDAELIDYYETELSGETEN